MKQVVKTIGRIDSSSLMQKLIARQNHLTGADIPNTNSLRRLK